MPQTPPPLTVFFSFKFSTLHFFCQPADFLLRPLHLYPPCLSCCIPFSPPPSCFLAPNSCHCAIMGLNLTQAWMVHKKQLVAHLLFISKAFRSPSEHFYRTQTPNPRQNVCPKCQAPVEFVLPVHTETCRLTTKPPGRSRRGLISKVLPFLRIVPAPLNSSFTSAARTRRDYSKQRS